MWIQLPSPKGAQPPILGHVCCRQTAGWIKMELGTEVGLGPGHTVLDGDPATPRKGAQQFPHLKFTGVGYACVCIIPGPCLLWPNGWMDKDETWHGGRTRPSSNCVKWGPSSTPPKVHSHPFLAHVYCGQTVAHLSYC